MCKHLITLVIVIFVPILSKSKAIWRRKRTHLQFDSDFYKSADMDGQPEDGQDRVVGFRIHLEVAGCGGCLVAQKPKARGSESPGHAGAGLSMSFLSKVQTPFLVQKGIQCPPVRMD